MRSCLRLEGWRLCVSGGFERKGGHPQFDSSVIFTRVVFIGSTGFAGCLSHWFLQCRCGLLERHFAAQGRTIYADHYAMVLEPVRNFVFEAWQSRLRFFPPCPKGTQNQEQRRSQKPATWYTYPQLPIQKAAIRPGSILDRQGGSIFNRRGQPSQQECACLRKFRIPKEPGRF